MANKMKEFKRNPGNIAFCYYRYSSDAQRDVSIDQQRQAAHEYAEKHGYIIPPGCEFEDRGTILLLHNSCSYAFRHSQ